MKAPRATLWQGKIIGNDDLARYMLSIWIQSFYIAGVVGLAILLLQYYAGTALRETGTWICELVICIVLAPLAASEARKRHPILEVTDDPEPPPQIDPSLVWSAQEPIQGSSPIPAPPSSEALPRLQ